MISQLGHIKEHISKSIRAVFQASYAVEAELLKAVDFPPLKRPLDDFINCQNVFYGYWVGNELAAVVEIKAEVDAIHIQSLVVHPKFFRQGIAGQLIEFVFKTYDSPMYTVETGLDNIPAKALYEKFGFTLVKEWDTDHGVRKVRFERIA
jgi:ribosomal protein S18 acetylase RimI-like enzyme